MSGLGKKKGRKGKIKKKGKVVGSIKEYSDCTESFHPERAAPELDDGQKMRSTDSTSSVS